MQGLTMTQDTAEKISKEMTIEGILSRFPQKSQKLAQEMTNSGLHCVGCGAAVWETLEVGMLSHGFSLEDVDDMVDKLNAVLAQKADLSTITLTKRAADKYRQILEEEGKVGWGLRFGDKAAGCSGFEYVLDYAEKAGNDDTVFHSEGVEIYVHTADVSRFYGVEIDFFDGLNGSGFKISNPNAKGSCGCGKSQNY
jgi:iron-sulfur cluster assembly protein